MQKRLDQTLQELHDQLASAETLTDAQRESMHNLVADIQAALIDNSSQQGVGDRLNEAALQLETSHPTLTNTIGRVVDLLSQIGI